MGSNHPSGAPKDQHKVTKDFLTEIYAKFPDRSSDGITFIKHIIEIIMRKAPSSIVVASGGEQSLGKSYFLNQHFGANFEYKLSPDHGKMTIGANIYEIDNMCILDLEGFDSNDNSTERENQNITLSLAFSKIYLLHIPHSKLQSKFIERFSYSYWNAIRHLSKVDSPLPSQGSII